MTKILLKIIITLISVFLTLLALIGAYFTHPFIPLLYKSILVAEGKYSYPVNQALKEASSRLILSKYDLHNPIYTLVTNIEGNIDESQEHYIYVFKAYRKNLNWYIDDYLTTGKLNLYNISKEEAYKIIASTDLSIFNPNPEAFQVPSKEYKQPSRNDFYKLPPNEQYFFPSETKLKHNFDSFGKLKIQMSWDDVKSIVKTGERALSYPETYATKSKTELHYAFGGERNINFIALGWDGRFAFDDANSKLEKMSLIKTDRTIIEVPVKPDGYFDFEAVKQQLE